MSETRETFHSPTGQKIVPTSGIGYRKDPFSGEHKYHAGLDLDKASGAGMGASVEASWSGTVVFAGQRKGYGNLVIIDHGNGITTRYGHLSAIDVEVGQRVKQGEEIGNVGATGRVTAPHLHFEVRENNNPVDPRKYFSRSISVSFIPSANPSVYSASGGGSKVHKHSSGPSEEERMEQARLEAEKQRKEAEARAAEEERQRNIAAQNVNAMLGDELFGMVQGFMQLSNLAGEETMKRQARIDAGLERPMNTPPVAGRNAATPNLG